jgi:hypothetical protein
MLLFAHIATTFAHIATTAKGLQKLGRRPIDHALIALPRLCEEEQLG